MFQISSYDIFTLRTPGGDRFTEFVDALIRAEAYTRGLPQSEICTNLRTNLGDGGVDTEVRQPIPDSQTGWFGGATCWQYKATQFAGISKSELQQEINKPYSKQLIQNNYRYRFCICDDLTPKKRNEWEEILNEEAKKINPTAEARVVTASDLAAWANQFPAIIVRFFKPRLDLGSPLENWGKSITQLTPTFVEVEAWAEMKQRIREHANFSNNCSNVVLLVEGEAGVGKTRLVYESLLSVEGANSLVVYAKEDRYLPIAYLLEGEPGTKAIIVADECSLKDRVKLQDTLNAVKERIRVICIDNYAERIPISKKSWLTRIPVEDVALILEQNFNNVTEKSRFFYSEISGGFVRLAADLCNYDSEIVARGNFGEVLTNVRSYLRLRLNDEELRVLEAISLFRKVGYRDDVKEELENLCEFESLKLDKQQLLETANKLKDVPGFVAFAGRYIYITPEVIARVAFEGAWQRWAAYDPENFLSNIPPSLLDSFLHRVSTCGSQEIGRFVGDFFRNWAAQLQPIALTEIALVERLVILAETEYDYYFARLERLIKEADLNLLLQLSDSSYRTRRSLVWLTEKMVLFPENFHRAESILWKLALAETEPNLANNATRIWQQLFRIYYSGTAMPFPERITKLEKRLSTENEGEIALALPGLNSVLETDGSRVVGPVVVGGKIAPGSWQPQDKSELRKCLDLAVNLLSKTAASSVSSLRNGAFNIAIDYIKVLIESGYLDRMQKLFSADTLPEEILLSLVRKLEEVATFDKDVNARIKEWLIGLTPQDFHGKLVKVLTSSPWSLATKENQEIREQDIKDIAREFCQNPELFQAEKEWILADNALGVWELGSAMGKIDENAACLDLIMGVVAETEQTALASEYIGSLLRSYPQHADKINEWIDKFEIEMPIVSVELFMAGRDATKAFERALKLADTGALPVEYFDRFGGTIYAKQLTPEQFYEIIKRLVDRLGEDKNRSVIQTAIILVFYYLQSLSPKNHLQIPNDVNIQEQIWQVLELTVDERDGEYDSWDEIMRIMAKLDLDRAARITCVALISDNSQQKMAAEHILVDLAPSNPDLIMKRVGEVMLDEQKGWHFFIEKYRFLIESLPLDVMKNWLTSVGVAGALKVARQLPIPFINEEGEPIVPPLTEFVLSTFEDDEETFQQFCHGSHGLQVYMGNMKFQKEREVEDAKKFLDHPLRRVREWAEYQIESCRRSAKSLDRIYQEMEIP